MEQLLSVADASRILGVVPATVRAMERAGRLPALRTASGIRLFKRGDVERLAAQRAGQPVPSRSPSDGATTPEAQTEVVQ
ncbi:MAG: helix-turn-helix domain-containing protein [Chloroflexota bacterium]|nr:helix-turn-helix domain-containing protein [Chloroflexota bacterium]